jgi:hypothetical protein
MMFPGSIRTKSSEVSGVRSISAFPPVGARHKRDGYLFRKTLSHSAEGEWSEK